MDRQTDTTQEQARVKLAFVILNYNTYEETIACIRSINDKIDTQDYRIIVVDNASTDNSLERLKEAFSCPSGANEPASKIELLCNHENLGFARGNNVGIRYVNEKYRPEFVVVLNSDTELIQRDLYSKLHREFENSGFALLGPMILTADGQCNVSPMKMPDKDAIVKEVQSCKKRWLLYYLRIDKIYHCARISALFILREFKKFSGVRGGDTGTFTSVTNFHQYQKQVVLQGAFLVFSQHAFDFIDGFDELTFLYYEEYLLYLNLTRHGLTIVYDPEICIYHKSGQATNKIRKTARQKRLFILQCAKDSATSLLKSFELFQLGVTDTQNNINIENRKKG